MRTILTFGALGTALASTLLLGPQWGIALGFLVYIAGNNVLLTRETNKLKAQLHKSFNDLPDLVNELVRQRLLELEQAPPPAAEPPATPASEEKTKPLPELEQRLSALDGKFETLLHLLISREAQASPPPGQQPDSSPETAGETSPPSEPQDDPTSTRTIEVPQAAAPSPTAPSADPAAELAAIRELLEKMAIMLAQQGEPASSDKETHVTTAEANQNSSTLAPRPTMDQLRAELDKLALELRRELDRPAI
ncbi:hypothetical protein [Thiofaba sp. EF100]|uniref:hypothetical protein n=1 Tax=Thiofaba sp. EF100 TaxID=3121274 RepID=UPI0032217063